MVPRIYFLYLSTNSHMPQHVFVSSSWRGRLARIEHSGAFLLFFLLPRTVKIREKRNLENSSFSPEGRTRIPPSTSRAGDDLEGVNEIIKINIWGKSTATAEQKGEIPAGMIISRGQRTQLRGTVLGETPMFSIRILYLNFDFSKKVAF